MAKNLKLTIKNTQIAQAINLSGLKSKLAKKKSASEEEHVAEETQPTEQVQHEERDDSLKEPKEEAPRIKARSKSAFAEKDKGAIPSETTPATVESEEVLPEIEEEPEQETKKVKPPHPLKREEERVERSETGAASFNKLFIEPDVDKLPEVAKEPLPVVEPVVEIKEKEPLPVQKHFETPPPAPKQAPVYRTPPPAPQSEPYIKLGPTGKHIKDFLPNRYGPKPGEKPMPAVPPTEEQLRKQAADKNKAKPKGKKTPEEEAADAAEAAAAEKKGQKAVKFKEFRDVKPTRKVETSGRFDVRDRQGLRVPDDDGQQYRKKRYGKQPKHQEDTTIRPSELKIRIPITIKDLAAEMKLKTAQIIGKLFLSGVVVTINDVLEDPTTIQLLGQEFGCEITIDTSEEERIRITDKTIEDEIKESVQETLITRAPIVAFMGHVDHGKTSLIDTIRKSNRAAGEAGAITQHIGAFRCKTSVGDIAILDTPGHEAFAAMRERGANVTDIIVLVVAGDEGIKQQTVEAIQHAKQAGVTIVVAINKSDKPNFNVETVYRQLAENELLPEAWGGAIITVNCSAVTGEGIETLLEMLAIQSEVLELQANPQSRARGTVLESEMHKGLGSVATVLVQNGTLRKGDVLVCDNFWGRVKTMYDEFGKELLEAGPSTPVEITGLSGLPEAGQEFIAVKNEKEAREIAEARTLGMKQKSLQSFKKTSLENMFQQASEITKKTINVVLRADVQGSLEAVKTALQKIKSQKIDLNLIFAGVGEVSESDVQLAAASKAIIIGFHTQVESHAESLIKQHGVQVRLHDIIYHAVDDVKAIMVTMLDKIAVENEKGKAEVKAVFKSSQHGLIAGCMILEGTIHRNNHVRVIRNKEVVWKGSISSLKRVKEDVKEVAKGFECGILLNGYDTIVGDIIEAYEITYITQEL